LGSGMADGERPRNLRRASRYRTTSA
jgi:hypothetical protein